MARRPQLRNVRNVLIRALAHAATAALIMVFASVLMKPAQAQTLKVLYSFTGGPDDQGCPNPLTMDKAGNLYGTTSTGCNVDHGGVVFRLTTHGSGWVFNSLYRFQGGSDGWDTYDPVVFGPDGALYGTTFAGGAWGNCYGSSCGTVFKLMPPATFCKNVQCPWIETLLHRFNLYDGGEPVSGYGLIFDQSGNLYGTTEIGGSSDCGGFGCGVVYKLGPTNSGWDESVIYAFTMGANGYIPKSGVIFDKFGNLYGTTTKGGIYDQGALFQLTPSASGWTERVLHSFNPQDEGTPFGKGLLMDESGTLYGTTAGDYDNNFGGTVFALSPGDWTFTILYRFPSQSYLYPYSLVVDAAGDFYGITACINNTTGSVFKLTPQGQLTDIYDFTYNGSGGYCPEGLLLGANGNVYGTSRYGGANGWGVVWEITP